MHPWSKQLLGFYGQTHRHHGSVNWAIRSRFWRNSSSWMCSVAFVFREMLKQHTCDQFLGEYFRGSWAFQPEKPQLTRISDYNGMDTLCSKQQEPVGWSQWHQSQIPVCPPPRCDTKLGSCYLPSAEEASSPWLPSLELQNVTEEKIRQFLTFLRPQSLRKRSRCDAGWNLIIRSSSFKPLGHDSESSWRSLHVQLELIRDFTLTSDAAVKCYIF